MTEAISKLNSYKKAPEFITPLQPTDASFSGDVQLMNLEGW